MTHQTAHSTEPHEPPHERYEAWREQVAGAYALDRCQDLLRLLLSDWPRRSRSVLVMGAGSGSFLETLWHAGFDVTGQDNDAAFLEKARTRLGKRAEFVLSAPDHLPFDDCSFDYAVAAAALEFWEAPEPVLTEMARLACSGIIIMFPNAWSLFGLECRLRKRNPLCSEALPLLRSPRSLSRLAARVFRQRVSAWASILPCPSPLWRPGRLFRPFNSLPLPWPVGAFAGLRFDFGPMLTGTPLLLRSADPVASAE